MYRYSRDSLEKIQMNSASLKEIIIDIWYSKNYGSFELK